MRSTPRKWLYIIAVLLFLISIPGQAQISVGSEFLSLDSLLIMGACFEASELASAYDVDTVFQFKYQRLCKEIEVLLSFTDEELIEMCDRVKSYEQTFDRSYAGVISSTYFIQFKEHQLQKEYLQALRYLSLARFHKSFYLHTIYNFTEMAMDSAMTLLGEERYYEARDMLLRAEQPILTYSKLSDLLYIYNVRMEMIQLAINKRLGPDFIVDEGFDPKANLEIQATISSLLTSQQISGLRVLDLTHPDNPGLDRIDQIKNLQVISAQVVGVEVNKAISERLAATLSLGSGSYALRGERVQNNYIREFTAQTTSLSLGFRLMLRSTGKFGSYAQAAYQLDLAREEEMVYNLTPYTTPSHYFIGGRDTRDHQLRIGLGGRYYSPSVARFFLDAQVNVHKNVGRTKNAGPLLVFSSFGVGIYFSH